jgi:hypothetical protein
MNTRNDRLNNEMFGKKNNYVKPLFVIGLVILTLLFSFIKAHAMGVDLRSNACHTFHIFAHEVEAQGETDGIFCGSESVAKITLASQNDLSTPRVLVTDTTSNDLPTVEEEVTTVTEVIVTPPIVEDNKPKCNNGEGNGSEGCSPANSEHANNDENNTTPSDDKSHHGG